MSSEGGSVEQVPDVYGQVHPVETPELLHTKRLEFETLLDRSNNFHNKHIVKAKEKGLHTDELVLQFLRCEVFQVELAAARYARYWDKRVEVFGPVSAFLPLTLDQAVRHDRAALECGFVRVVDQPHPHSDQRTCIFIDPSKQDRTKYARDSMVRAFWYVVHRVLLEDELVQKKGMIFIGFPHHAKFSQFDKQLIRQVLGSIQGCLPVRLSAFHLCHPPAFFRLLVFPIIHVFMSPRTRKRFLVHSGTTEHVLEQLETNFGLTKADLPKEIGGDRVLDGKTWLAERALAGR